MSDWLPTIVYEWATARNELGPEDARTLSDLLQKCNPNKDLQRIPIVELRKCLWEMCTTQDVTSASLNTLWRVRNLADEFAMHWPLYDSATPAELKLIKVSFLTKFERRDCSPCVHTQYSNSPNHAKFLESKSIPHLICLHLSCATCGFANADAFLPAP